MASLGFAVIVRLIQLLFGIILLGVAAGGTTRINEPSLNYLVFVGAFVLLALAYVGLAALWKKIAFPLVMCVLEVLTLIFLIVGVIVVPVTLFNKSSSGANDACRIILNGDAERAGLVGDELNDARVGCQCALAGAIFDGFSVILWICSLVLVIVAWKRTK